MHGLALAGAAIVTGDDLCAEAAVGVRRAGALLRAQRERVLILRAQILYSSATFSAVSGMESMPYCAFIFGFTKRQPIVVS